MSMLEDADRTIEQGFDDLIWIHTRKLAAKIKQKIHLIEAAARLVEQGDILQDQGGLLGNLQVHLAVFLCKGRH